MTWVFDNEYANWGNLTKNTEEGTWEKWTRHSFTLTVNGNDFILYAGEEVWNAGSYVIEGDELTLYMKQAVMKMTRIKGDLLNRWNSATEKNIFGN